jgi:hypothetical protein
MFTPFKIDIAPLRITDVWRVSWNRLHGALIHPEIQFESLVCLTLKPDFVLDFGWSAQEEGIAYDLQINRGHFGWDDVVFYERFYDLPTAVATLQKWIDLLSTRPEQQLKDSYLQERLAIIARRKRFEFIQPSGEKIIEPLPRYLRRLILKNSSQWWESGSADASLRYVNRASVVQSQLIFLLRDPHGVHIEYHPPSGPSLVCIGRPKHKSEISLTLSGATWILPSTQFVSRRFAAKIIEMFINEETGDLPKIGTWRMP